MAWLLARLRPGSSKANRPSDNSEAGDVEKRDRSMEENPYIDNPDPELERRVRRKTDWNLLPLLFALYLLAFLDRSNIGNAQTAGLSRDLGIANDPSRYQWFLTIFYISYIIFEPTIVLVKFFSPHKWFALNVFGWGLVSAVQAGVYNWSGEMALRFFMGVFEAAFGPGTVYLLSFFYLRDELGFRQGIFLSAAPLATTFAGALAYGITSGHAAIASWRLLFLVEGLPTVAMAVVTFIFLPDSPHTARFLTPDERKVAYARTVRQNGSVERKGGLNIKESLKTLLDVKPWLTALMYFSANVSFSSLPVFLPTIIKEMGFTAVQAQGLSAPPYFLSFIVTCFTTWLADKTQQRGLTVIVMATIAGVGYVILATTQSTGARYTAVFIAAVGVFPVIGNLLPWTLNNAGNDSRRGIAVVLLNVVGQCGPLLGTRVFDTPPYYVKGQAVCAAFMFLTAILATALRFFCQWENKKLDEKYGRLEDESNKGSNSGRENYGPRFRYVL